MTEGTGIFSSFKNDPYTVRARVLPVLLVVLPGCLASIAWFPEAETWWSAVSGLVMACGVPAFIAQVGRDRGKKKEAELYRAWGGKPTTRFLRHRNATNKVILARRHRRLQELMVDIMIPTEQEEENNPTHADEVYDACALFLRERTRDKKKFLILFQENVSYGFRRNLWGLKPLGLVVALLGLAAIVGLIFLRYRQSVHLLPVAVIYAAGNALLVAIWLFWVRPEWVRIPAEGYAEQLLAAIERL